jgi:hypothetical protein
MGGLGKMAREPDQPTTPLSDDDLWGVCELLQKHGVKYVLVGACACILHGLVRSTVDVDLLIEPSADNMQRAIDAISELPDHAARELTVQDLQDNVVVKICDAVEVDLATRAWTVTYDEAIRGAQTVEIEGVKIVYAGLDDLIKSKSTYREQDKVDCQSLLWLRQSEARKKS